MYIKLITLLAACNIALALGACPLSVSISDTKDHTIQVEVTNAGNEPVTVFKGNTVLSDHATKNTQVLQKSGKEVKFEGVFITYKPTGLSADMFHTLQPGETITSSVNVAKTHKLAGIARANVQAIQSFKYVTGTTIPTSLKEMSSCVTVTSEAVSIKPDQSRVESEHTSRRSPSANRLQKRDVSYASCTDAQTSSLKTSVTNAIGLAQAAYTATDTQAAYWTTWFKSTGQVSKVKSIYNSVINVRTYNPTISCKNVYEDYCNTGNAMLYCMVADRIIVACPNGGYWSLPEFAPDCAASDYDKAGSILHEMTHLYGTDDFAYGRNDCLALTAAQAANNADTYELYAESVKLKGCNSP